AREKEEQLHAELAIVSKGREQRRRRQHLGMNEENTANGQRTQAVDPVEAVVSLYVTGFHGRIPVLRAVLARVPAESKSDRDRRHAKKGVMSAQPLAGRVMCGLACADLPAYGGRQPKAGPAKKEAISKRWIAGEEGANGRRFLERSCPGMTRQA